MSEQVRFQYFQHQLNARKDNKLSKLLKKEGWQGVGLFWGLLEDLGLEKSHRLECDYEDRAWEMHTSPDLIKRVVEDYGLFKLRNGYFYSDKLNEFLGNLEEKYQKRAAAGKKGGTAKAMLKQNGSNATAMLEQCQPLKEIREEEKKEDNNACLSTSTTEAENKHDAVALSNDDDAATQSFNFSEEVNDREYLEMTKQYMYRFACSPTSFTDRLISLLAPDDWKGAKYSTDFSNQKWRATSLLLVEHEEKYRDGRIIKAERESIDLWIKILSEAHVYDTKVLDSFRGVTFSSDGHVKLIVKSEDDARYIDNKHVDSIWPIMKKYVKNFAGLQYSVN